MHDAYKALLSILDSIPDIKEIFITEIDNTSRTISRKTKKERNTQFIKKDSKYVEILQSFVSILDIKGRPFGQLNSPWFGMSDGNEGLQWNIGINTTTEKVKLGVNLEGMKYINWPIATFILNELRNPSMCQLKTKLENPDRIFVRFARDAWQVQSRPGIVEENLNGSELPISEIDVLIWHSILSESLGCLSEIKGYRGRSKQTVTLKKQPNKGSISRLLEVSPHLDIWTPIDMSRDVSVNIKEG